MSEMTIQELVRSLSREKRTLLCELLIEIILDSKKNELSNELVMTILALWTENQLITMKNTLRLIKKSYQVDPIATKILLSKMELIPFSQVIEVEALNG